MAERRVSEIRDFWSSDTRETVHTTVTTTERGRSRVTRTSRTVVKPCPYCGSTRRWHNVGLCGSDP